MTSFTNTALVTAAHNAAMVIDAIYKHVDAVEAAGGPGTTGGWHETLELLRSLQGNRSRMYGLVFQPLQEAVRAWAD